MVMFGCVTISRRTIHDIDKVEEHCRLWVL